MAIKVVIFICHKVKLLRHHSARLMLQLGNHDKDRVSSRLGSDLVDALNMVILLLPGTPVTYYGEEIGEGDTRKDANSTPRLLPLLLPQCW